MSTPNVNSPASSTRVPSSQTEQDGAPAIAPDSGYPPQRHAGAVGLGPEYGKDTSAVSTEHISVIGQPAPMTHRRVARIGFKV
jgi:hypothetical protein